MAIKKVKIRKDCPSCGMCEEIGREVFEMDNIAIIKS